MKYCPMRANSNGFMQLECYQDKCAWWDRSKSCCAVLSIAIKTHFNALEQVTQDALKRMENK